MRKLGKKVKHSPTRVRWPSQISIVQTNGKKRVTGLVHGKEVSTSIGIKVIEDAGAGFQGLSGKMTGELRTISGTLIDVDTSANLFTVPSSMQPNYCVNFLSPVVQQKNKVTSAVVEMCASGQASMTVAPEVTGSSSSFKSTLSLGHMQYVPLEAAGSTKFDKIWVGNTWRNTKNVVGYYHKLDMSDGARLCVLSGTITGKWPSSQDTVPIIKLDPECVLAYKSSGYRVPANVKINGKQQWVRAVHDEPKKNLVTSKIPFELLLTGPGKNILALRTTRRSVGDIVQVSLDGVTLAHGKSPLNCRLKTANLLGDSDSTAAAAPKQRTKTKDSAKAPHGAGSLFEKGANGRRPDLSHLYDEAKHKREHFKKCWRRATWSEKGQKRTAAADRKAESRTEKRWKAHELAGKKRVEAADERRKKQVDKQRREVKVATMKADATKKAEKAKKKTEIMHEKATAKAAKAKEEKTKAAKTQAAAQKMKAAEKMMTVAKEAKATAKAKAKAKVAKPQPLFVQKPRSRFINCKLVKHAVNDTQTGFSKTSVVKSHQMIIMGSRPQTRTCALNGIVRFTSQNSVAVAYLDPNYRDPTNNMPFCFPMSTMIFFGGVVASTADSPIVRTIALQIEPHGRLVVIGKETRDIYVRLDGISYHPLMKFNKSPTTCAPYCFPTAAYGAGDMGMSGCVKYCTPTQYVRQDDTSLKPSKCKCDMLKRIDCFLHNGIKNIRCGQFKMLMGLTNAGCKKICAGQLSSF